MDHPVRKQELDWVREALQLHQFICMPVDIANQVVVLHRDVFSLFDERSFLELFNQLDGPGFIFWMTAMEQEVAALPITSGYAELRVWFAWLQYLKPRLVIGS